MTVTEIIMHSKAGNTSKSVICHMWKCLSFPKPNHSFATWDGGGGKRTASAAPWSAELGGGLWGSTPSWLYYKFWQLILVSWYLFFEMMIGKNWMLWNFSMSGNFEDCDLGCLTISERRSSRPTAVRPSDWIPGRYPKSVLRHIHVLVIVPY